MGQPTQHSMNKKKINGGNSKKNKIPPIQVTSTSCSKLKIASTIYQTNFTLGNPHLETLDYLRRRSAAAIDDSRSK